MPTFVQVDMNTKDKEELEGLTALGYYELFQPESFVTQVVHQSRLYATQKDIRQAQICMNLANYRCMEAMLLHVGYAPVPRKDNQPVYVASNKYSAERTNTVGRLCRTERKKIQVKSSRSIKRKLVFATNSNVLIF